MEALNNQTVLDDLGLNIDTFQGELPNVDEVEYCTDLITELVVNFLLFRSSSTS